jgi:hypothetical protein
MVAAVDTTAAAAATVVPAMAAATVAATAAATAVATAAAMVAATAAVTVSELMQSIGLSGSEAAHRSTNWTFVFCKRINPTGRGYYKGE